MIWPKLISAGLIGHVFPPKDKDTDILVVHAKTNSRSGSVISVSEYYDEERTEGEEASHVGYGTRTKVPPPMLSSSLFSSKPHSAAVAFLFAQSVLLLPLIKRTKK